MADTDYETEGETSDGEAMDGISRKLIGWIREDMTRVRKWRKEAREDFAFYAGSQYDDKAKDALRAKNKADLTWNRVAPLVNAITGSEINNRREIRYFPREIGDAKANEILSDAAEWFRDECNAEDEESDAFEDAVIAGMGWTETRLSFDDNPDGDPKIERLDPLEMGWDCYASKPNLEDARRLWRIREMSYDDAAALTGEKSPVKLHATWADSLNTTDPHDQDKADNYDGSQDGTIDPTKRKTYKIAEIRWVEKEPFYRGPDLNNPTAAREYTEAQVKAITRRYPDFPVVKQTRRRIKRAFIGKEVLGKPDYPMVPPGRGLFGWECITGYRDKVENQFYGVVRAAKDPQRWSNKFFSKVIDLLNSQSKGGIMAEKNAFDNVSQAETSWAKADVITWLKDGALASQNPKVLPKPVAQFPAGFFTLFQEAKESISDVTGLSKEFIGTREVEQAGVLEYQRRQSSLNLLASIFNALRRYRKRQGRMMLYLIQEHLADGRLVRIVGEGKKQYVPLMKAEVADSDYDIIVDDSPSSPNEKDRTWQILMQMLPMAKDMLTPEVVLELLEYSPIPPSIVEKMKMKAKEQAQKPKPPSPEEIKAKAAEQKAHLDAQGKQMDLAVKGQEAQMDMQAGFMDLALKQREMDMEAAQMDRKFENDMRKLAVEEQRNEIAARRAAAQRVNAAKQ